MSKYQHAPAKSLIGVKDDDHIGLPDRSKRLIGADAIGLIGRCGVWSGRRGKVPLIEQIAPKPMSSDENDSDKERRAGVIAALGSYGTWGLFPLLFHALESVHPLTIVAHRVVWSFLLVGGILWNRGRLDEVRAALSSPASSRGIFISAVLLAVNWLIFVWAVQNERVLEVSFGYFINPLVSVAIGLVLLAERLNRMQWVSISVALVAVGVQAAGVGGLPLVSLSLAVSFGFYGYFRKTVNVGSAPGLFVETLMLLPLALAYLVYSLFVEGPGPLASPWLVGLLLLTGPATSWALILFAFAARRLMLSTMGMFQYISPSMHFLLAIWLFGEPMNGVQLFSFVLIWISLAIYTYDSYRRRPKHAEKINGGVHPGQEA